MPKRKGLTGDGAPPAGATGLGEALRAIVRGFGELRPESVMETRYYECADLARLGRLPEGFRDWGLCIPRLDFVPVAHIAAAHGHLPEDFDRWDVSTRTGWTAAHQAALYGHLPEGYDGPDYADGEGVTVSDVLALRERAGTGPQPPTTH
ncbi:MAG: ankyrin repeat domain-containing protein [Deltaproteobacteria bacterium]|jgi:hypothetical protein|nr:ankyrin repeat domain-containing protein [Deltaproteobacteria bacterium]